MTTQHPERLNLWDRFFNRYRKELAERGTARWTFNDLKSGRSIPYCRHWVEYTVKDRLTGSVTIEREYLNDIELT